MGPSRAHGRSAGPAEAYDLPEANGPPHGPPKVQGPRGHCTPCPPLGGPGGKLQLNIYQSIARDKSALP